MSLKLRWVGAEEIDRVAEARMLAYARGRNELAVFQKQIREEVRSGAGDWLLAERDGEVVGTATHLPLTMWVRGHAVKCQGVGFVGTVRTQRRKVGDGPGVGSAVMWEVLRMAKERGFVASALMPFRATYYETFGYGIVERKKQWTLPLELVPRGEFGRVRYYREADFEELVKCRQRVAERGQCDIERSGEFWKLYIKDVESGFLLVDREGEGPVKGWMTIESGHAEGLDTVQALWDFGWEDIASLRRFIYFLGSLKDQYRFASVHMPADFPLNLLLKEKQMTHRLSKNHPNAQERQYTRMQMRVLDHVKFLDGMTAPLQAKGRAVVAVHEEDGVKKFEIDVEGGRVSVKTSAAEADVECGPANWAIVASGDVRASLAVELGMLTVNRGSAVEILDVLGEGTVPYCREYF